MLGNVERCFGYDSERFFNIGVIEGPVVFHITGRFLHLYNLSNKQVIYHVSENGAGFGPIAVCIRISFISALFNYA